jgi:tetratricopeptide (TPR) repeat protein
MLFSNLDKMRRKKFFLSALLIVALVSLLYFLIEQIEDFKTRFEQKEILLYLPSGKFIKAASLGFDELVADFLFIKSVLYFGSHYLSDKEYTWLYHLLDISTTLSPHFKEPYEFGAVVLSFEVRQVDKSNLLLKKAIKNNPDYWRFPFYLGFNYFYFKQDFYQAAKYMEKASLLPGRPKYLPKLTSRLYAEAGQPRFAIEFLEKVLQNTQDQYIREEIQRRIKRLKIECDLNMLETAIRKYKEKFNRPPQDLGDLVSRGLIDKIPEEPFGGEYFLKDSTVFSSSFPQRLKVYR